MRVFLLPEASGNSGHDGGHEMVQVSITWGLQLEGGVANVVQGLVINDVALVSVLNKLMERKSSVVRLDNGF